MSDRRVTGPVSVAEGLAVAVLRRLIVSVVQAASSGKRDSEF
jgi:hypothetical protein